MYGMHGLEQSDQRSVWPTATGSGKVETQEQLNGIIEKYLMDMTLRLLEKSQVH